MKISHEHKFNGKVKPSDFANAGRFKGNKQGRELTKPEVSSQWEF